MKPVLPRPRLENLIGNRLAKYPVVAVLGARQTGKTYMAKRFASSPAHHFDLENSYQAQALEDNALTILGSLEGTVVIDEVQELPSIFPALESERSYSLVFLAVTWCAAGGAIVAMSRRSGVREALAS